VIPDRDIWRAANLLIREHGDGAEFVAAHRADEMLERSDHDEEIVWLTRLSVGKIVQEF
jgi:hypothetical protein